jgi:hypothetical protein
MGDFEYLFTFYALLLGLAVANVALGFGDMWRERKVQPIGICPPLYAVVLLLSGMNIWLRYWHSQHGIHFNQWWLLSAAGVTIPYVFASRAMFPVAGKEQQSLENHYLAQRHVLLAAFAIPPFVSAISNIALLPTSPYKGWPALWILLRILLPLALMTISNRTIQRIGLLLFIGFELTGLFRW